MRSFVGSSLFLYPNPTVPLGQSSYTCEVRIPSCEVSLERSCRELSKDISMDSVTVR
jgi:hypothetical protein